MELDPKIAAQRFYELLWPHRTDVLRIARILCGNDAEADDLAQETFLKAYNAIGSFRPGTDARAWLLRILRNARIDRARSGRRQAHDVSLEASELDLPDPQTPQAIDDAEVWHNPATVLEAFSDQQILDALQELPEEIRLTLLLVDVQQLDHREAAAILDVPVGTIKSRTHRGRAMLRQVLLPLAREMRLVKGP